MSISSTKTRRITMVRGQTFSFTETVRDENHQRVDLTNARVHLAVRTDMKSPPVIKLPSEDPLPAGWRTGVVLEAQEGDTLGDYTATIIPADTEDLVALGADDPYYYEVWIEIDTMSDDLVPTVLSTEAFPHITRSQLDLYPEAGAVP